MQVIKLLFRIGQAKTEGKDWLADLETKEKEATGIKNLKIRYTKVREYRESHRNTRKITQLKLWNIAEQTKEFKKVLEKKQLMEEKARRMKNINLEGKL